ncbi:large ribosomal subunit protein uL2mz [Rhododendron vialii]|uniref:large ribosomal subunit protein uL2mz n=1 Tax=Rhododendron vialii TaxID=182163 RepID=UPI00265FDC4B|nr:large ribosomal subunit protein uL2mz [Rhododendron vialii]XP_058225255.1 large ribosomal subunit protein uL2mz [Rhododendron vialii]XP_058225256.1 large ribosomal subunit protein uL2mz [Rhododendron vialii]XP_058225257.1 large ribosomal subunit protein uL2mz [Rhododendron vialii]
MTCSSSKGRALRQFILSSSKSAGRNSSGHITIFHRGGGAKRLQRSIDLKRSTSSIGIVERIEYDPNRSSRIALVRWIEGVQQGRQRKCNMIEEFAPPAPRKILEPTTTTIRGPFSFSSLPGKVDQRKVASFSPGLMEGYAVVGLPTGMPPWSKGPFTGKGPGSQKTCAKDVFFSALSSPKAMGEIAPLSFSSSFGFPRIAVAGAKPAFFAPRMREKVRGKNTFSLCEIRKWATHSIQWAHRIKRKAALSWQSFRGQETDGLVGAAEHNESKLKTDQSSLPTKDGRCKVDRAPVTYIIASHQLEAGKMVMNCDWSKPPTSN